MVEQYFHQAGIFKFTLWKDNKKQEAKPFGKWSFELSAIALLTLTHLPEIGPPVLPRFFLVIYQSGVERMHLDMGKAVEERLSDHDDVIRIQTAMAQWVFKFQNGYTVVLKGPLTAHVRIVPGYSVPFPETTGFSLKCEHLQFDGETHDKLFSLDKLLAARQAPSPSAGPAEADSDERRYEEKYTLDKIQIPAEPVNGFGIPQATMRCLEVSH